MAFFYFFKNDGRCNFVKKYLVDDFMKILQKKNSGDGVTYYLNLEWTSSAGKGVNTGWLDSLKINYIKNIDELPSGSGVYVSSYDGDPVSIEKLKKAGVPVYERICPWVLALRRQISITGRDHRCIIMLDKDHMVYNNYRSIFPENTVFIDEVNYMERLQNLQKGVPVHFIVYSTFRPQDAAKITDYLDENFPHPDNIYWLKGICSWVTDSGVFEEIRASIKNENLSEIWVICSNENNRSVKSLISAIGENGSGHLILKDTSDVPENVPREKRIGILRAPIPYGKEKEIIEHIKNLYCR